MSNVFYSKLLYSSNNIKILSESCKDTSEAPSSM